jgi:hypothetical protein
MLPISPFLLTPPLIANLPTPARQTYYVAPNGNPNNPGTLNRPLESIQQAIDLAKPGDRIYLRGGRYRLPSDRSIWIEKDGTPAAPISLLAYPGERPILDARHWKRADRAGNYQNNVINHTANYWRIRGLEITGSPYFGYFAYETQHNIWENLDIHHNDISGFGLYGNGSSFNTIRNSDFHHNYDPLGFGQNADGLAIKFGSGIQNRVEGVRAFANSDDGIDFWSFISPVTVENSWAYENGYDLWGAGDRFAGNGNGFKLGGAQNSPPAVAHIIRRSLAWGNASVGFTDNNNPGQIQLYQNTSFNNQMNYEFYSGRSILRNNLSFLSGQNNLIAAIVDDRNNDWNLPVQVNRLDFQSLNSSLAKGRRQGSGALPTSTFLKLQSTSDLIDRGIPLGLPYKGFAPDLGAYEQK